MSRQPYRRTADAQRAPHRVVAQPIGPFPRTSPTQHAPPTLYDTSVSSATLTNSAEDIRSTGSGAGYHPSHHSPLHQQGSAGLSSPSYRSVPRKQPGSYIQNYEAAAQYSTSISSPRYPSSNITQSEPGVPTQEHDRFAAYVNRFAELDPRMDHRLYNTACKNQVAIEEKKLDDVLVSVIEQQEQLLLSKDRFRSRAAQRPHGSNPQRQHSDQLNMSVPKSRSQEVNGSSNDLRTSSSRDDAASDFVLSSPSGRTRDLARRFEQRMAEKQQQQQQRMEYDAPSSQPSTTASNPVTQPHYYYPQQSRLAATYIPVSKQAASSAGLEKAPSDEHGNFSNMEEKYGKHDLGYENDETLLNRSRSGQQSLSENDPHLYRRSPQSYDTLHHSNISRIPSYPAEVSGPSSNMDEGSIPLESSERKVNFDQRRYRDYPQIEPIPSSERHHSNVSEQPGQQTSRGQQPDRGSVPSRQRSESLGPPLRRRPRSLNPPIHVEPVVSTHRTDVDNRPAEEPVIRRLGHRAEIETPSPARVQELRKKLWTEDELLQVRVRSSYHDTEDSRHVRAANYGPEMAGNAGQRNARSLSPKAKRSQNANSDILPSSSMKSREHKGMLFKSRYYEAALRGESSNPSKPASSNRDGRFESTLQMKRSFESSSAKASLHSGKSSDMKEDVDTTQAVPFAESNNEASKTGSNARSARLRHLEKLREKNTAMKDDAALSLIRKITLVNKDDPQAALAQIQALLQRQQHESESVPVGDPEATFPDGSVGHDSASVPAVGKAHPMNGEHESDDESDGTTVSSMTNPTYQELNVKDNAVNASAAGRARPSFLGEYTNSPSQQLRSVQHKTYPASQNNAATSGEINGTFAQSPVDATRKGGNRDSDFPTETKEALSTVPSKESKIAESSINNKSSPSFFAKLNTLIAPQRDDAKAHAEELVTKIQMWDDMSTGVIPATSYSQKPSDKVVHPEAKSSTGTLKTLGSIVTNSRRRDASPGNELKRAHPWDASMPVRMGQIDVKDTSMDCGDGVETQYTPKYAAVAQISADIENPRKNLRKDHQAPPVAKFGDDDVDSNVVKASMVETEVLQAESRQHQQAKALSDEFDSAWVSLPSSTYFGTKSARSSLPRSSVALEDRQRPDRSSPVREKLSKDEETEYLPDGAVEVQYLNDLPPNRPPDIQIFSPEEGDSLSSNPPYKALGSSRGSYPRHQKSSTFDGNNDTDRPQRGKLKLNGSFESGTAQSLEAPQRSRGRGLRGFLKRKQAERDKREGSLERDAMTSSSMGSTRQSIGNHTVATQPLGHAVDVEESPSGHDTAKSSRYYRRSSKSRSPSRGRARSLDERRIRNPSLARKFNRLLRVYDHDSEDRVS